jgi:hypothetical protein
MTETQAPAEEKKPLTPEEIEAERKAEIKAKRVEAYNLAFRWTDDQKDYVAQKLLESNANRRLLVLEEVMETWARTLTDDGYKQATRQKKGVDYRRRLEWVRDYFGTSFTRQGQPRFRSAKLSAVIGALVKFCLSAGDRDKTQPADLGMFELLADVKTGQALVELSNEGEGTAITAEAYNQTHKLLRLLEKQFGAMVLECDDDKLKGTKVGDYIEEIRSKLTTVGNLEAMMPGARGVKTFTEKEKKNPQRRAAYEGEKRVIYARELAKETAKENK